MYDFTGMTSRGEVVLDVLRGGLVGFEGQNSESPCIKEGAGDISENGTTNTPNTPYARARSQDSSFTYEKENNDNSESDDIDDLIF